MRLITGRINSYTRRDSAHIQRAVNHRISANRIRDDYNQMTRDCEFFGSSRGARLRNASRRQSEGAERRDSVGVA